MSDVRYVRRIWLVLIYIAVLLTLAGIATAFQAANHAGPFS